MRTFLTLLLLLSIGRPGLAEPRVDEGQRAREAPMGGAQPAPKAPGEGGAGDSTVPAEAGQQGDTSTDGPGTSASAAPSEPAGGAIAPTPGGLPTGPTTSAPVPAEPSPQAPTAETPLAPAPEAGDASPPTTSLDPADEAVLDSLSRPSAAMSPAQVRLRQRELLTAQLAEADRELADSDTLLPALVLGLGVATTVTGFAIGASKALRCGRAESGCAAHAAAGVFVVGGLVVSGAGFLWWFWSEDDQRELRSKRYHIARELQWTVLEPDPDTQ